jgi:4-aminobutyrate aminotransferase-like enzyme
VAAFICEPIQGVGGTVELAEGYLPEVYKTVRAHGGVCIADEVQTGFGRTGTNFWGFQNHGVTPDIGPSYMSVNVLIH